MRNWQPLPQEEREAVEKHLGFARNLRIRTEVARAHDVAEGIVQFARDHQATQIFMGRSLANEWHQRLQAALSSALSGWRATSKSPS